ncbi:MAG: orotidine-5'-phosphate decarboxylase [Patescibacteria group bacterium]
MNPRTQELKNSRTQLILALDVDSFSKAKRFVDLLYPEVKIFKVGLQLWTACHDKIIKYIRKKGGRVFLDLKFFDIPNTVANASKEVVKIGGIEMFTVHAQGGQEMMRRTKEAVLNEARASGIKAPLIIGVTVLTSEAKSSKIIPFVISLTKAAKNAGLDGVVASVKETRHLRQKFSRDLIIVTPGIRLAGDEKGGQKRIATPEEARSAGSNYIVVGRPILEAENPVSAAREIIRKISLK